MKSTLVLLWAVLAGGLAAQGLDVQGERIRAHVKFLSSDLLEGRGVGARGGKLAVEYMAAQFALAGARPAGDDGTWFQKVPLVGLETRANSTLSAAGAGGTISLRWLEDFVGNNPKQTPEIAIAGDGLFVGHGIVAPEFGWNDYEGVNAKGKVVVMFTNEPPSQDPAFFGGRALTYYGRWTYKFEEATRQGAAAAIIIHTDASAGYGWNVVRNSWGREEPAVKLESGGAALGFAGWITAEAAGRILKGSGQTVPKLLEQAGTKGFRAFPLGIKPLRAAQPAVDSGGGTRPSARGSQQLRIPLQFAGVIRSRIRPIDTENVAAEVRGSDPKLADEYVVFTAHWDHLGMGRGEGDQIFNGALDNATGCGTLLELARAWAALRPAPRRSALFLAVTAEEGGLRGSDYYARRPLRPLAKTAVVLNYDSLAPLGRPRDLIVNGAERTTIYEKVQEAAQRLRLEIQPDQRPEQGSYFRSDHFPFARLGVPAFSIGMGARFWGKDDEAIRQQVREVLGRRYHQPSDEYSEDWDFAGMELLGHLGLLLGSEIANQDELANWLSDDPYRKLRDEMLKQRN